MTIYKLTELLRYTVTTLREIERGRYLAPGATNQYVGQFQYVLDRIEQIAAQERTETAVQTRKLRAEEAQKKAERVDGTMADWLTKPKGMSPVQASSSKHNYDLTTILQLVAADILTRKEAREILGLSERLRDLR